MNSSKIRVNFIFTICFCHSAIESESIKPLSVLHSGRYNVFKKRKKNFLPTKSWKKQPQKLLRKTQIHFFSLMPWAAQTAQTVEFVYQNLAYRLTVYRTGLYTVQLLPFSQIIKRTGFPLQFCTVIQHKKAFVISAMQSLLQFHCCLKYNTLVKWRHLFYI